MQIRIGRLFQILLGLASLSLPLSWGASVSVAWDPNSEPDLAGYRVYYTANDHRMIDVGNQTNATLSDLQEGLTYTIYATAYNTAGLESAPSEPITYTVPSAALPPAITTHPLSQTVIPGQPFTFAVEATGAAPLSYQWFKNGAPIAAATSPTFSVAAAALSDAGTYTVFVSNPAGEITSHPATLTVIAAPPVITAHPLSQTVSQGQSVALSVQATGTGPLAYQWFKDGSAIPGATSATYAVTSATEANAGQYTVRVTNLAGSVQSAPAMLTMSTITAPRIAAQPVGQSVQAGQSAAFTVEATGSSPLVYQWFRTGSAIPGATGAKYTILSATEADAGHYSVRVSNPAGAVMSAFAPLKINAMSAPSLAAQPLSQTVAQGKSAAFSVEVTGTAPFSFQWHKEGSPIAGATSSTHTIASVTGADAGIYHVIVSNAAGEVTSGPAALSVIIPPAIATQPTGQTVTLGQPAGFTVAATGTAPFAYQWFRNGAAIPGATSATYDLASVKLTDTGDYSVRVTNSAGEITSAPATLALDAAPRITSHPASLTVKKREPVILQVAATGTGPLTYQWFKNGSPIIAATGTSYSIASAATSDAGTYTVHVSNAGGGTTSNPAILTVNVPPAIATHPVGQTVEAGQSVAFTVKATGTGPLLYQWFRTGTAIPGGTSETYAISSATEADSGHYSVRVTNAAGAVMSAFATLTVNETNATRIATRPSMELRLQFSGSTLQLAGLATPGETYVVQSCADLGGAEWTTIQSVTLDSNGQFLLDLPHDPAAPFRFFRTVIAEP